MVRKESPVSAEQADDQMNRSPGREKTFRYPPRDPRQGSHDAADEKIPFKRSKKLHSVLARMRELREKELSGLHEKSQSATSSQFSSDSAFSPNNESERHQRPDQRDELSVRDPDDPQLDHSHDLVNASRDGQCMRDHSNTIQAPSAPLGRGLLSPGKSTGHPVVAGDLSSRPREEVLRDQIREATREKIYLDSIPTSRGENAPSGVGESVTDEETTEQIYSSGTRENFGAAHRAPSYKEKHRSKSPSRSHRDSRVLGRNVHQGAYSAQSPRRSRGHVKSASAQEGGKRYPMDGAPQSTSGKERALIGEAGRKTGRRIQNLQTLSSDDDTEEIFHNDDQEAQRRVNVLHGPRLSTSLDAKTRSPSKTNGHMDLRSLSSDSGEDASTLSIEDESTGSSSGYGSTGSSSSEYSSIRPRRGQIYDNRSNAKPSSRANLKNRYSASSAPTVNNEKDSGLLIDPPLAERASEFVSKIVEHLKLHQPFASTTDLKEKETGQLGRDNCVRVSSSPKVEDKQHAETGEIVLDGTSETVSKDKLVDQVMREKGIETSGRRRDQSFVDVDDAPTSDQITDTSLEPIKGAKSSEFLEAISTLPLLTHDIIDTDRDGINPSERENQPTQEIVQEKTGADDTTHASHRTLKPLSSSQKESKTIERIDSQSSPRNPETLAPKSKGKKLSSRVLERGDGTYDIDVVRRSVSTGTESKQSKYSLDSNRLDPAMAKLNPGAPSNACGVTDLMFCARPVASEGVKQSTNTPALKVRNDKTGLACGDLSFLGTRRKDVSTRNDRCLVDGKVSRDNKAKDGVEEFLTLNEALIALEKDEGENWDGVSTLCSTRDRSRNQEGYKNLESITTSGKPIPVEITTVETPRSSQAAMEATPAEAKRSQPNDVDEQSAASLSYSVVSGEDENRYPRNDSQVEYLTAIQNVHKTDQQRTKPETGDEVETMSKEKNERDWNQHSNSPSTRWNPMEKITLKPASPFGQGMEVEKIPVPNPKESDKASPGDSDVGHHVCTTSYPVAGLIAKFETSKLENVVTSEDFINPAPCKRGPEGKDNPKHPLKVFDSHQEELIAKIQEFQLRKFNRCLANRATSTPKKPDDINCANGQGGDETFPPTSPSCVHACTTTPAQLTRESLHNRQAAEIPCSESSGARATPNNLKPWPKLPRDAPFTGKSVAKTYIEGLSKKQPQSETAISHENALTPKPSHKLDRSGFDSVVNFALSTLLPTIKPFSSPVSRSAESPLRHETCLSADVGVAPSPSPTNDSQLGQMALSLDSLPSASIASQSASMDMKKLVSKIDDVVHRLIKSGKIEVRTSTSGDSELHQRSLRKNTAELLQNLAILRARRSHVENWKGADLSKYSMRLPSFISATVSKLSEGPRIEASFDIETPTSTETHGRGQKETSNASQVTNSSPIPGRRARSRARSASPVGKNGQDRPRARTTSPLSRIERPFDKGNIAILRARRDRAAAVIQKEAQRLAGLSRYRKAEKDGERKFEGPDTPEELRMDRQEKAEKPSLRNYRLPQKKVIFQPHSPQKRSHPREQDRQRSEKNSTPTAVPTFVQNVQTEHSRQQIQENTDVGKVIQSRSRKSGKHYDASIDSSHRGFVVQRKVTAKLNGPPKPENLGIRLPAKSAKRTPRVSGTINSGVASHSSATATYSSGSMSSGSSAHLDKRKGGEASRLPARRISGSEPQPQQPIKNAELEIRSKSSLNPQALPLTDRWTPQSDQGDLRKVSLVGTGIHSTTQNNAKPLNLSDDSSFESASDDETDYGSDDDSERLERIESMIQELRQRRSSAKP